jgi:hypothetical protein
VCVKIHEKVVISVVLHLRFYSESLDFTCIAEFVVYWKSKELYDNTINHAYTNTTNGGQFGSRPDIRVPDHRNNRLRVLREG